MGVKNYKSDSIPIRKESLPLSIDLNSYSIISKKRDKEERLEKFEEINQFYNSLNAVYAKFYKHI